MSFEQGSWSASVASSELVAEDEYRGSVTIQLLTGEPTSLGIGQDAVDGEGIQLRVPGDSVEIRGAQARDAINGITASSTSGGGYQES